MSRPPWIWQAQSLLLGYPDDLLKSRLDLLRQVADTPLLRFLSHVASTPLTALQTDYVATFDQRKRCCLYLTYYAHGDTRNRGVALLLQGKREDAERDGDRRDPSVQSMMRPNAV